MNACCYLVIPNQRLRLTHEMVRTDAFCFQALVPPAPQRRLFGRARRLTHELSSHSCLQLRLEG